MSEYDWSPQQKEALRAVKSWIDNPKDQIYRLFGYAGVGKTVLAKYISQSIPNTVFGAYTGKAALVLREKGCMGAQTLHSMIYIIDYQDDVTGEPYFRINPGSNAASASLIIVDEVSMVNEQIGRDLMSFGAPILVLGDPFQLPPVSGTGFFTSGEPDILLTEIHRQAADNPIIKMSLGVRKGYRPKYGVYGESKVIRASDIDAEELASADIVITGKNNSRHMLNDRIREIRGLPHQQPVVDDQVICLKNNHELGILNGQVFTITDVEHKPAGRMTLTVDPIGEGHATKVKTHQAFFNGESDKWGWKDKSKFSEFDFGYAITAHKSQASQWDHVYLFDESSVFREYEDRWLYTAITRAAEKITIVA